jgi:hypothetical protein
MRPACRAGAEGESKIEMAVRRRGPFSLRKDRRLIQMAAESVTLEEAAAAFGSSVATIERMARKLGLPLKGRDSHQKRLSARIADVELKAKGK